MNFTLPSSQFIERLQRMSVSLEGVFTFSNLCNLIGAGSDIKNSKVIDRLVRGGFLKRVWRGVYTTPTANPWVLASRIKAEAYVSMDSVLANNALVGSIPAQSVSLVYTGRKTVVPEGAGVTIRYFSIKPDLYFGFSPLSNGVKVADNEKAYLDMLYFYMKGARFIFDPLTEVLVRKLELKKINTYLKRYQNPKFVKFVKGSLREND